MTEQTNSKRKIFIVELADAIHRRPATIRQWDRMNILPESARPSRNDRGWRYWTEDQVPVIQQWISDMELRPGKGLSHYNPSPEEIAAHIEGQRLPRDAVSVALRKGHIDAERASKVKAGEMSLPEAKRAYKGRGRTHEAVQAA